MPSQSARAPPQAQAWQVSGLRVALGPWLTTPFSAPAERGSFPGASAERGGRVSVQLIPSELAIS